MRTEFAKAIEAGEDVVGKEVVLLKQENYRKLCRGTVYIVEEQFDEAFTAGGCTLLTCFASDFEFKHVLDKQKEENVEVKLLSEQNKLLEIMLEGAKARNKQYEQQLFDMRMENARLELAAQRWEMFNCEANRNIADKLLNKLADEAV